MHDYVHNYNSSFKDVCAKGVDAWLEAHRPEVAALIDKAAEQTMSDETVYSEVAKCQFQRVLSDMAGEAVNRAMARQAKKAMASAKKR